jgi:hypothetical protein
LCMGSMGLVVALLAIGYVAGVWTAFLVLRQPQRAYEDEAPADMSAWNSGQQPNRAARLELDG